jgi:hypothetical protein
MMPSRYPSTLPETTGIDPTLASSPAYLAQEKSIASHELGSQATAKGNNEEPKAQYQASNQQDYTRVADKGTVMLKANSIRG